MAGQTLFEKIWNQHVVASPEGEPTLLYIDLHLVHEVTSPQAFDGLRLNGRGVRRPDLTLATADHNVPTDPISTPVKDPVSRRQLEALEENCREFNITVFPRGHENQGIVHIIGPELGVTQPGMTIVCGDSHTSTHGAFGALAFGIGTSEVEHVLATQTLPQQKAQTMSVTVRGKAPSGVSAKDIVLAIVGRLGTGGGAGHVLEYRGEAITDLSMEGRMTVCNMSIEAGARAGLVAVDDKTIDYLRGRPGVPEGEAFERLAEHWRSYVSDKDAVYDREIVIEASELGAPIPPRWWPSTASCPHPTSSTIPTNETPPSVHSTTWVSHRESRFDRSRSTWSSSVRAPTHASKTCERPRSWRVASAWRRAFAPWSCPVRTGSSVKPKKKDSTRSFSPRVSNGVNRAARCVWG